MPTRRIGPTFLLALAILATQPALAGPGPHFEALRQDGVAVTEAEVAGWRLYYFGYTMCPDICPTSLMTLTEVVPLLGAFAERLTPVFVTVDPERDTPEVLRDYVSVFHPRLIGLTPTRAGLEAFAAAYKVRYARVEMPDGRPYAMDHSATFFLVDPTGTLRARFPHNLEPLELAAKITAVMAGAGATQ